MSKEQSIARKINPIRLLDAGADLLSNAVKSTAKLPGRLTSFIGNKLDDSPAADGGKQKLENLRVTVMVDGPAVSAGDVEALHYKVSLVDKKTGDSLHTVLRTFAACQQVVVFVRSMAPKLEIPVQPQALTARTNIPLLVEERRKFFQAYANVATGNATSANLREVRELVGYSEYLAAKEETIDDRPALKHVTNDSFASSSAPMTMTNNSSLGSRPKEAEQSSATASWATAAAQLRARRRNGDASPQESAASPTMPPTQSPSSSASSSNVTSAVEECFRVIDDGGAGYITLEDMPAFAAALPSTKAQRVFAASVKKTDAFNQQGFVKMVEKVAQESGIDTMDWVNRYRATKYQPLYAAFGSLDECGDTFCVDEVRALMYILRVSGVRLVTQQEIDEEAPFLSLPVSFDDFCDLMNLLMNVVPFDQLWRDLQPSQHGSARIIHALNKACGSADKKAVQALRGKIQELGGGTRRSNVPAGKCSNCDAVETRLRGMKLAVQELQQENEKLRGSAGDQEEVAKLQQKLATAAARESELSTQLSTLKTRVAELERQLAAAANQSSSSSSSGSEGEEEAEPLDSRCNLFLLNPLHLGSSAEVPVVDLPGPVVFQLPDAFQPLGFVVDAFLCQPSGGVEYLAIRDSTGRRCCAWTIDGDVLSFPWTLQEYRLPHKKWARLQLRFFWSEHAFDFVVDGVTVFGRVPMRDEGVGDAASLDIFPRDDVLLCYANMNFFR